MADEKVSPGDVQQIEELHRKLTDQKALAIPDVCAIWRLIKPYWPVILNLVKLIPIVGAKVADILAKLGNVLDLFCTGASK